MYAPVPGSEAEADAAASSRSSWASSSSSSSSPSWRARAYRSSGAAVECCSNVPTTCPEMSPERRNLMVSYIAGLMFATAWWLLVDANVLSIVNAEDGAEGFNGVILWWFYVPGVISTLALIMGRTRRLVAARINLISPDMFSGDAYMDDSSLMKARIFMFVSFILAFAGLLGSGWILFGLYVVPDRAGSLPKEQWPGVALLLQNILIFTRSVPARARAADLVEDATLLTARHRGGRDAGGVRPGHSALVMRFGRVPL